MRDIGEYSELSLDCLNGANIRLFRQCPNLFDGNHNPSEFAEKYDGRGSFPNFLYNLQFRGLNLSLVPLLRHLDATTRKSENLPDLHRLQVLRMPAEKKRREVSEWGGS
mmetsp:Transcript_62282/g.131682  ORF Transcript_62282/g.131682 Transcript_62282/m.131682 type:complete len:109 (+) Transcript_62282:787-1113(+)